MSLVINNNMMAANTARNLSATYGRLAQSVQRLSTGMRINSAADDAAGLAIREMMRAEIATLRQGIRNAQDGISMIQTAEGALAVIDEKLIRMKELAEQAATGTYTQEQRLIIHSEFAAMASEIDRIAESTKFNGIYLLNGNTNSSGFQGQWSETNTWVANGEDGVDGSGLWTNNSGWTEDNGSADAYGFIQGGIKIHFGTTNQREEDYYFVRIADSRTESLFRGANEIRPGSSGSLPEVIHLQGQDGVNYIENLREEGEYDSIQLHKDAQYGVGNNILSHAGGYLAEDTTLTEGSVIGLTHGQEVIIDGISYTYLESFNEAGTEYSLEGRLSTHTFGGLALTEAFRNGTINDDIANNILVAGVPVDEDDNPILQTVTLPNGDGTLTFNFAPKTATEAARGTLTVDDGSTWTLENAMKFVSEDTIGQDSVFKAGSILNLGAELEIPEDWDEEEDGPFDTTTDMLVLNPDCFGIEIKGHHIAETSLDGSTNPNPIPISRGALPSLRTQHQAQDALEHIDTAILRKENIRANLGSLQNRLENTITNLAIQAENLQASESRISDVDIANEMTEFVRNQVITQAAVAMLGQANSLPQYALRLLG